jgi:F420-0:gamma-glutamyl ligase
MRMAIAAAMLSSCAALAEDWTDERVIVASESVVNTFEGSSMKLAGQQRSARSNLYLPKADDQRVSEAISRAAASFYDPESERARLIPTPAPAGASVAER